MKLTILTLIIVGSFLSSTIQAEEQAIFSATGVIESTKGGFKFPDGSTQASAAASSACVAITSLPYAITSSGVYCFTGNLSTSMTDGDAITILANNVTIDMNGWMLDGLAAGLGTSSNGIYAYQRKNIIIRNGTVRGFFKAIILTGIPPYTSSESHIVEYIRADRSTHMGIDLRGRGSIARHNMVVNSGKSSNILDSEGFGILVSGSGVRAINNDISNITGMNNGEAVGLRVAESDGALVQGNRIHGINSETGVSFGIQTVIADHALIRGNSLTSMQFGISIGGTGKYMNNLTNDISTDSFSGGTAVGTNN